MMNIIYICLCYLCMNESGYSQFSKSLAQAWQISEEILNVGKVVKV